MNTFPLKIVSPDGLIFDGEARKLTLRTTEGDMTVMARHMNLVAPLGAGQATLVDAEGQRRNAACVGGILSVVDGAVTLLPTSFAWDKDIDIAQAQVRLRIVSEEIENPP